jgi:prevent-host-death family protein
MARTWQLQEAKAKFSEMMKRATSDGPQIVSYRGVNAAVLMSIGDYHRLAAKQPSLVDYLLGGPRFDDKTVAAINDRPKDTGRAIEL